MRKRVNPISKPSTKKQIRKDNPMSNFPKDRLESQQAYDDDLVGDLKRLNKGLQKIEDSLDEIHERRMEDKYESR